ncbi:DUF4244 domain-containing protein [Corynebacterium riegelii]|uniref:Uncharacterized protein n=1 Tax=Corynebacterium riegelii TaxID=156976 RepID=A0A0K1REX4_9CORY|nr:DUF4244 domain-containing protein [Corynebacterium riegelii]AKV59964.1 hypothetical protein AK829_08990 [Corynebacterium riegelii]PLA15213.1 DUF4244 domain-containing protein [Corynebacterium riegelii]
MGDYLAQAAEKLRNDRGLSTIEYAFGSLAAAALAGVLYMVVNSNGVSSAIESVITDALNDRPK